LLPCGLFFPKTRLAPDTEVIVLSGFEHGKSN
jgi:hypothetical protein